MNTQFEALKVNCYPIDPYQGSPGKRGKASRAPAASQRPGTRPKEYQFAQRQEAKYKAFQQRQRLLKRQNVSPNGAGRSSRKSLEKTRKVTVKEKTNGRLKNMLLTRPAVAHSKSGSEVKSTSRAATTPCNVRRLHAIPVPQ